MTARTRRNISIVEAPAEDVPPGGPDEPTVPYTPTPSEPPRRPGRPRGARTASRPSGASSPSRRTAGPDYRTAVMGIGQIVAGGLAMARQPLDAWAVATHTPTIADALHELATTRPEVAAVLDRVLAIGPYGVLIAATLPLFVQIAHNHKLIPAETAAGLGAVPREILTSKLVAAGEQMASDGVAA